MGATSLPKVGEVPVGAPLEETAAPAARVPAQTAAPSHAPATITAIEDTRPM